jgi:hypothetical protein
MSTHTNFPTHTRAHTPNTHIHTPQTHTYTHPKHTQYLDHDIGLLHEPRPHPRDRHAAVRVVSLVVVVVVGGGGGGVVVGVVGGGGGGGGGVSSFACVCQKRGGNSRRRCVMLLVIHCLGAAVVVVCHNINIKGGVVRWLSIPTHAQHPTNPPPPQHTHTHTHSPTHTYSPARPPTHKNINNTPKQLPWCAVDGPALAPRGLPALPPPLPLPPVSGPYVCVYL